MSARQHAVLEALGIVPLVPRTRHAPGEPPVAEVPGWDELEQSVRACRLCALCETRTQTVFGVGNRAARLMVVGEAPGAEEDRQGEPFVGSGPRASSAATCSSPTC